MVGLEFQQLVNVLNKKAIPMYIQIQYVNKENDISVGLSFDNYGIPGCGVFKGGIHNQKSFWLKINCIQMKLPNFENWSNGELSKSTKI